MKKKHRNLFVIFLVVLFLFILYTMLPKYKVQNSYSLTNSFHGTRDTELKVIVYHFWDYFDDELMEQIYEEHTTVNDYMDTSLEIKLYYSKWHDEPFKSEMFYRE